MKLSGATSRLVKEIVEKIEEYRRWQKMPDEDSRDEIKKQLKDPGSLQLNLMMLKAGHPQIFDRALEIAKKRLKLDHCEYGNSSQS